MAIVTKTLPGETVAELQRLVGSDLVYLVAVDVKGNQTLLTPPNVTEVPANFNMNDPVKNQGITGFDSAAYLSYQGSCIYCYTVGGQTKCYSYPC